MIDPRFTVRVGEENDRLVRENAELRAQVERLKAECKPEPIHAVCPKCGGTHVDQGEWATSEKLHRSHLCEHCGHVWRPFEHYTVGVERLAANDVEAVLAKPQPTAASNERHCPTCICGKRAPVQADRQYSKGPGSIEWAEHVLAWSAYAAKYGTSQSAERLAERQGFAYGELVMFLGHEPTTWSPR